MIGRRDFDRLMHHHLPMIFPSERAAMFHAQYATAPSGADLITCVETEEGEFILQCKSSVGNVWYCADKNWRKIKWQ